ncbi:vWA domain-containing protein [Capnocytophaga canimorsus]|uniref:vWA domain-containing protein n=1 Tax=Capnocytophaga canimorsus TaxID=28188 RepID=UPI0028E43AAC|nr:von Willebrand factor type A domain-containing protein [Capnocytophaga canimorsus]MDT9500274.1 von Willebrand factor type A domain-containing protein [Capnocytophaga canimorsus]
MRTILLFFLTLVVAYGQEYELSGIVTDESKTPLVGAFVIVKGTTKGTQTDFEGKYLIRVKPNDVLIFSYIGFESQEITIKKQKTLNVVLKEDQQILQDVVIVGYGNQNKSYKAGATIRGIASYQETETYKNIQENKFKKTTTDPISTFSADVDRASYSNIRRMINNGSLPDRDAVRIEEMINYFDYDYPQPDANSKTPFKVTTELSEAPWNSKNYLLQIGVQAQKINLEKTPPSNIVFLIDVSGSMDYPNKLPLLKSSFKLLLNSLKPTDKVAIVVYAGRSGLVLPSTSAKEKAKIEAALDNLNAGGSTAGGEGLKLAYKVARENFIPSGNNRIILATDGDFNVGINNYNDLQRLVEEERKSGIYISVLGFGMGNYRDDMTETIANKGNGNYAYIDNIMEAKKVLVNEFGGTFYTVAKDVKFQLEFNPKHVKEYRLVGYENRMLNTEDFEDDQKDAGEVGSGHTVTVFYEIVPTKGKNENTLRYQKQELNEKGKKGNEIAFLKIRYKNPDSKTNKSIEVSQPIDFQLKELLKTSDNFRFAAAVAEFGMLLRNSEFKANSSYEQVINLAQNALADDKEGYRKEFIRLVESAKLLKNE